MSSWWPRQEQRERDLARGVDADLVSDNRRMSWTPQALVCIAFLLIGAAKLVNLQGWMWEIAFWTAMAALLAGAIARAMRW